MDGLWNNLKHRFSQTLSPPEGLKAKQSTKIEVKYQHIPDVEERSDNSKDDLFKSRLIDEVLDDIGLRLLHWKVFAFICILVMTSALGTAILSAILPSLKPDWNISAIMAGVLTLSASTGKITGTIFWGWVSDKYGRKRTFIGGLTIVLVSAFVSAFSTNYYWLWISLFFVGFGATITFQIYVIIVELFPTRYRSMFSVLTTIFWTLGFLLSAVISMELSVIGYHWALATVCFPAAILLISIVFLPESPHFYLAAGDEQKALDILQDLAPEMDFSDTRLRKHGPETQRADFTQLFRSGYWKITICAFIMFFITYLSHYDLIYTTSDVAGSQNYTPLTTGLRNKKMASRYMYSIMAWMNLPEFVIIFTAGLVCYLFTVKRILLTVMLLTLVSQAIALFLVNQRIPLLMVTMISRSLLATDTTLLLLFVSLVYPPEIRSIGAGTCASAGRIGIILGPFIFETWFAKEYFYGIVFNVVILSVALIATVLLPLHSGKN
ncbi:synaptic vesicle 2-related protein-like [Dendronephthya gigantea]|uniref:synaptic vesicle 2-related protein-like n=1 Tax=Dendronephthya gigantea TaxID=151771 RepID=UPI00106A5A13|nr:synaptic vesicle 2-related protein-like [Dendronephthya gigantea]